LGGGFVWGEKRCRGYGAEESDDERLLICREVNTQPVSIGAYKSFAGEYLFVLIGTLLLTLIAKPDFT
jgi:hypothetical protein